MLTSARICYRNEGVPVKKRLSRFVADYRAWHVTVNCDKACCKNIHAKNHNIACEILERADLREKLMAMESFSLEDCEHILFLHDTTAAPPRIGSHAATKPVPPLSFGCNLSDEQMVRISSVASANHLFCVSYGETVDLKPVFLCQDCKPLVTYNIRLVALFFDILLDFKKICWDWKRIMEEGHYIVSMKGVPVTARTLSSSLSSIKKNGTAASMKLKREMEDCLLMSAIDTK